MHTSFLYHAFGVREQNCSRVQYEDKSIVLKLQTRKEKLCCFVYNSKNYIRSGFQVRRIRGVPIGSKAVILEIKVQRLSCKDCHSIRQERIHFVTGRRSYSNKLARLVVELPRLGTIKTEGYQGDTLAAALQWKGHFRQRSQIQIGQCLTDE